MSKHTEGPWFVSDEYSGVVVDKDGIRVAAAYADKPYEPYDATLIAAAPELLEALEEAIPSLHTGDELPLSYYKNVASPLGKALRAIAKAKGEK